MSGHLPESRPRTDRSNDDLALDDLVALVPSSGLDGVYEQSSGPRRSARTDALILRWRQVALVDRTLVLGAVALVLLAGLVAVDAATQRPAARHAVHRVVVDSPVPGVDALGCPAGASCTLRMATRLVAAVRARVPAFTVLSASEVVDARTGRVYRRDLLAVDPHDVLSVVRLIAACVPGGTGNSTALDAVSQLYAEPPGGGFGAPEHTRVTPVREGCFAYASYRATRIPSRRSVTGPAAVLGLVTDPALAVHR